MISIYQSASDTFTKLENDSFEDLCRRLSTPILTHCDKITCQGKDCPYKKGPALIPGEVGPKRNDESVKKLHYLFLDYDDVSEEDFANVLEKLDTFSYCVHNTHSDKESNGYRRFRIALPLSKPVSASEWRGFVKSFIDDHQLKALHQVDQTLTNPDENCINPSRLFFLPSRPKGTDFIFDIHEGLSIDVDRYLTRAQQAKAHSAYSPFATGKSFAVNVTKPNSVPVASFSLLRKKLLSIKNKYLKSSDPIDQERAQLVSLILDGKGLDVQIGRTKTRNGNINRIAGILTYTLEQPKEIVRQVIEPSVRAMDVQPEGLDHWLGILQYSLDRSFARKETSDKERDEEYTAWQKILSDLFPVESQDWIERLQKDPKGRLLSSITNTNLFIENHPDLKSTLRFNELEKSVEVHGGILHGKHADTLEIPLKQWFEESPEAGFYLRTSEYTKIIHYHARENAYDPLKDYLRSVVWDRIPRLDTALETYFHAATVDKRGADITDYVRKVSAKFFIGAAARGLRPGEYVKAVLVLESPQQNFKKSAAFRVLGGDFYADSRFKIGSNDSTLLAARTWIQELPELSHFKQAQVEELKSWVSIRNDVIRAPYARQHERFPRRTVYAGTTNENEYLHDKGGNVRFWCILILQQVDEEALKKDRDQLWAEAVYRFDRGELWWFDDVEESLMAARQAEQRVVTDDAAQPVLEWILRMPVSSRPAYVTSYQVSTEVFDDPKPDKKLLERIRDILLQLHFTFDIMYVCGSKQKIYRTPDVLLTEPIKETKESREWS